MSVLFVVTSPGSPAFPKAGLLSGVPYPAVCLILERSPANKAKPDFRVPILQLVQVYIIYSVRGRGVSDGVCNRGGGNEVDSRVYQPFPVE